MPTQTGDTCRAALELITGDRNKAYGDAFEAFTRISAFFETMTGIHLEASQAACFMMCVKLSRESNLHSRDNVVDFTGYADLYQYCKDREAEMLQGLSEDNQVIQEASTPQSSGVTSQQFQELLKDYTNDGSPTA